MKVEDPTFESGIRVGKVEDSTFESGIFHFKKVEDQWKISGRSVEYQWNISGTLVEH